MNALVILQARTDSSRLPGKALLPVRGLPSAVLAALRAANTGLNVVLATSDRPLDDQLAEAARAQGIAVFRGSADNVRGRFLAAAAGLHDDDVIVRLTADNLVPDGGFVSLLLEEFARRGSDYLNPAMLWSEAPYGLSAELMRAGALRASVQRADTAHDREHVTPVLRAASSTSSSPVSAFGLNEAAVRCTMDTYADYERVCRAFDAVDDPVNAPWRTVLQAFTTLSDAPFGRTPGPGLVLGTAQLASAYGTATKVAPPSEGEAIELVRRAVDAGAVGIDTARAYPGSENVLGKALRSGWTDRVPVITKLSPLAELGADASAQEVTDAVEISVLRSLNALGAGVVPHVLLHRAHHLDAWDGAVMRKLIALREQGTIRSLGVSVSTPEDAFRAIEHPAVAIIQFPFHVLDRRWAEAGIPARIAQRTDLEVHVRSVFLQGILLRPGTHWPAIPGVEPQVILERLAALAQELGRASVMDLCVAWVRSHAWVSGLVIGMERLAQLEENLPLFAKPALTPEEASHVTRSLPQADARLLDPSRWDPAGIVPGSHLR